MTADIRVHVQPVTPALVEGVRALQVEPGQVGYVGDPAFNLANAQEDALSEAMAILADDDVVGFYRLDFAPNAIVGRPFATASVGLRAFLIDARRQGRGYGARAALAMCDDLRRRHPQRRLLLLAVHCRNRAGVATYRNAGFVDTGELLGGGRAGPQHLMLCSLEDPLSGSRSAWDNNAMDAYRRRFLELALRVQALCFGMFTLKSGRISPYFFNAGRFDSGVALAALADCYADAIDAQGPGFDMLFGPAYKGIPLASALACSHARRGRDLPIAFNRKEAKTHGEGGSLIGAPMAGRRVLIVDDVITAGTAIRQALTLIRDAGGTPAAIAVALDREEVVDPDAPIRRSATQVLAAEEGIPVIAVATLSDLLAFAGENTELVAQHEHLRTYRASYGCPAG